MLTAVNNEKKRNDYQFALSYKKKHVKNYLIA